MAARPSILLVDDVPANLLALEAVLADLPCDLVRASSGAEALRHLLQREFAMVLLDVQMPEMDGFEVARLARAHPSTREVPIIFVTAMFETEDDIRRGYEAGVVDFLFKPLKADVLRSKVSIFLELYTGRRRLADEIEAHKKTLVELEAFSYSVSHDLRAPLRPLDGFSQILLEDYGDKLDERARDYLHRIRAAAQRMGQLIEDLLELSRVARADIVRGTVDLVAMATTIVGELRSVDPSRDVELVTAPHAKTKADPRLLRVALDNLVRNAWKFTSKKEHARIELGITTAGAQTVYFVRDNGVGFNPAFAGKLFQAFQRLHSPAEFEGTGIGLAIVARIVHRHGGRIWAESTQGEGATFYFTLSAS